MEDLYAGIEHMVTPDVAESIKVITRRGSERIIRYAFEYCRRNNRKMLTIVHKANIMKMTDGMFLDIGRKMSEEYPDIEFEERIVDNMCMQLVQKPHLYDVMVMENLYGDILERPLRRADRRPGHRARAPTWATATWPSSSRPTAARRSTRAWTRSTRRPRYCPATCCSSTSGRRTWPSGCWRASGRSSARARSSPTT